VVLTRFRGYSFDLNVPLPHAVHLPQRKFLHYFPAAALARGGRDDPQDGGAQQAGPFLNRWQAAFVVFFVTNRARR
jgi:hypothetical protein